MIVSVSSSKRYSFPLFRSFRNGQTNILVSLHCPFPSHPSPTRCFFAIKHPLVSMRLTPTAPIFDDLSPITSRRVSAHRAPTSTRDSRCSFRRNGTMQFTRTTQNHLWTFICYQHKAYDAAFTYRDLEITDPTAMGTAETLNIKFQIYNIHINTFS